MADLFKHVMKTIDTMEQLSHRARPVTPATIAQGVRQVYEDQGLPLDEGLLQEALVPAVTAETCVRPENPPIPSPAPSASGISFMEIALALGMVVGLTALVFNFYGRANKELEGHQVEAAAGQMMNITQAYPTLTTAQLVSMRPDWLPALQIMGDLEVHPASGANFALDHVTETHCEVTRQALANDLYLANGNIADSAYTQLEINGVVATGAAAAMALPCHAGNNHIAMSLLPLPGHTP